MRRERQVVKSAYSNRNSPSNSGRDGGSSMTNGHSTPTRNPKVPAEIKPGFTFPILHEEFDEFSTRTKKFRIGDDDPTAFQMFRLSRGIYGQRQADAQMVRIKLPYGGVTADQMDALAEV